MPRIIPRLALSYRIVASVALGLAVTLSLLGIVVLWTIHESAEAAYRERVTLAQTLEQRIDAVLGYAMETLEREGDGLRLAPGGALTGEQRQRLADLRFLMGGFAILSIVDTTGTAVWTYPDEAAAKIGNPAHHPSVLEVIRTGSSQITELPRSFGGDSAYACLAVPMRDVGGRLSGALMAELHPKHPALNLLPSAPVGDGVLAQLINGEGQILAGHPGFGPKADLEHRTLLDDLIATRTPGYRIHEPSPEAGFSNHVVAYAPVSLLPSWGVIVEQPSDIALATPHRVQYRLGLFGLAILLLAASLAWFDVRRIVRPLRHLTAAAERFAAGKLDEPVELNRADELGILARAFETMRQRLRASLVEVAEWNRELERRVSGRTAELERRNRELGHLNSIATTLSASMDVKSMLERTLDHVLQITGAEVGCFRIVRGGHLSLVAEHGLPASLRGNDIPTDQCICSQAIRRNEVIEADSRTLDLDTQACRAAGLPSLLAVPLPAGDSVQGVLLLASPDPDRFKSAEFATLAAIGRQVGIALTNASLYEHVKMRERERAGLLQRLIAGQEEERRRLAQELHDDASQALASLQLGLERLAAVNEQSIRGRELAMQLQGVAAQTLATVHRLAVELRPSILDDIGLVAAIERYLREFELRSHIEVDFAAVGVDNFRLIAAAETTVFRIVQAALTNVLQHAQAQHVSVLMEQRDRKLVVVVEDDGRGFDLAAVRAETLERRLGLAGMVERANLIGATITIETGPSRGTTVFLEVPLELNRRKEEVNVKVANLVG